MNFTELYKYWEGNLCVEIKFNCTSSNLCPYESLNLSFNILNSTMYQDFDLGHSLYVLSNKAVLKMMLREDSEAVMAH